MTASGDRQRGDLLAATGENPMTVDRVNAKESSSHLITSTAEVLAIQPAEVARIVSTPGCRSKRSHLVFKSCAKGEDQQCAHLRLAI